MPLTSLIKEWTQSPGAPATIIVGVDGPAGAGKSSFCAALKAMHSTITIVHMDDFFVPLALRNAPSGEFGRQVDWRRVLEQVLVPLIEGTPGRYQRFDWESAGLGAWYDVPTGGIVLLDGVYSTREEVSPLLTHRVWVSVPPGLGLKRGIDRDGKESRDWWMSDWLEDENRYLLTGCAEGFADVVIDGTRGQEHYERGEFVRKR